MELMPTWVIYLLAGVFIVSVVSGGYFTINHMISSRDATITKQQETIAAQEIDINNLKSSLQSAKAQIARQAQDLKESQAQATRIKQADAEERKRQTDFDRNVEGINTRDTTNLNKINEYQRCVAADVNNIECGKLLQ
jgi:septal ring factor EnvC (AmiA/AmiB activator)